MASDGGFLTWAQAAVDGAMSEARRRDLRIAAVVLDHTFTLAAAQRMDGAYPSTVGVAQAKAHAALNFRASTADVVARIKPENRQALQAVQPTLLFIGGGVPLLAGEQLVGAVGVSGGSEADDVACAEAAAAAVKQFRAEGER